MRRSWRLATGWAASSGRERPEEAIAAQPPGATGRILVVGHCTCGALQAVMQVLDERFDVSFLTIPDLRDRFPGERAQRALFAGYSGVFFEHSAEAARAREAGGDRVVVFPNLFFYGFHPDLVYVWDRERRAVKGPLDDYHSSIAVWGYLHGLPPDRVLRLYRAETYERLGFHAMFEEAFDHLVGLGAEHGFDLRPLLVRWLRRGNFMHSINHPKSWALQDVARLLLARIDPDGAERRAGRDVADLVPDILAHGPIFPVYPELGRRLGVRGEYAFKPGHLLGRPDSLAPRCLTLEQFVAASYRAYDALPSGGFTCDRLADPRYQQLAGAEARP